MAQATQARPGSLIPARFSIYTVDKVFDGYHFGESKNGSPFPHFSVETAREIMRGVEANDPEQRWWETDSAIVTQHECDDKPVEFPKITRRVEGVVCTLVPVGAGLWVWDLVG